ALLGLNCKNHIIATGGSAAYSTPAMEHLKKDGLVVFLHVEFEEIVARVHDFDTRGIARSPGQSFEDLFQERQLLYNQHADIKINCASMSQDEVVDAVCGAIAGLISESD
ncbi:MAG: shikimate kinase, partial [Lentisphaerae bacterium]|nr:shikimate kinase [Lentisphaerota bacterium]